MGEPTAEHSERYALALLGCQFVISLIVLGAAFYDITQRGYVFDSASVSVITLIVGVWLGRGVDGRLSSPELRRAYAALLARFTTHDHPD